MRIENEFTNETSQEGIRITYTRKRTLHKFFWVRYIVATLIFVILFGLSKLDLPPIQKVTELVKTCITYDLNKGENLNYGEIPAFQKDETEAES